MASVLKYVSGWSRLQSTLYLHDVENCGDEEVLQLEGAFLPGIRHDLPVLTRRIAAEGDGQEDSNVRDAAKP